MGTSVDVKFLGALPLMSNGVGGVDAEKRPGRLTPAGRAGQSLAEICPQLALT